VIIAAALVASGAVFAADIAKDHLDHARAASPNPEVTAPAATADAYGDTLKLAPSLRFRLADDVNGDMTYDVRWRVPEPFGYHPPAFDSAEPEPAAASDSAGRDAAPREGRRVPRVQF
jgi:hypothetical protein